MLLQSTRTLHHSLCSSRWQIFRSLSQGQQAEPAKCPVQHGKLGGDEPSSAPELRPYTAIPGPDIFNFTWDIIRSDTSKPFPFWAKIHKAFGPIARFNLLGVKFLMSFTPEHWPDIVRAAGKTPGPLQILPWLHHEEVKKKADPSYEENLIALKGEEWRQNRTVLDAVFSSIPRVQSYLPMVDQIGDELVRLVNAKIDPATGQDKEMYDHMYSFSNEVIGLVVFGQRLGSLSAQGRSALNQRFFTSLVDLFSVMSELTMSAPWYKFIPTPKYRRFERLLKEIEEICQEFMDQSDAYHKQHGTDPKQRFDLMQHMRDHGQSPARILRNATTMFVAGSDSTTHTLMWLLYNLGRFPEVQSKLREEVLQHLPKGAALTSDALHQLKYLRATVKESMRLTPTASGLSRVYDYPVRIADYEIPQGTLVFASSYTTSHEAHHFPEPQQMKPERWLETDRSKRPNSWLNIPFGAGPRICQAFRLAELEAYVSMVKMVQNFQWTTQNTVEPSLHMFIKPDRPLELVFSKI